MDPLTLGRKIADAANQAVLPLLEAATLTAVQLTVLLLSLLRGQLWRAPQLYVSPQQQTALLRTADTLPRHEEHARFFRRKR